MKIRSIILWMTACALGMGASPALAQSSRTVERISDLEQRMAQLLQLQEAFLPTLERMESRLETLERRMAAMPTNTQTYDARRDVEELQRRLDALERYYENALRRQSLGYQESAWLKSEYDIVSARLNGTEDRCRALQAARSAPPGFARGQTASSSYGAASPRSAAGYAPIRNNVAAPAPRGLSVPVHEISAATGAAAPGPAADVLRGLAEAGMFGAGGGSRTTIVIQVFVHGDGSVEHYREVR